MEKEILIYTDDSSKYGIFRETLESEGFSCSLRADLKEVLEHTKKKCSSVVIIDFDLPCVTKTNLLAIKKLTGISQRVIVAVNDITDDSLQICVERYGVLVLKKPFLPEDLTSIVNCVLEEVTEYDLESDDEVNSSIEEEEVDE